MESSISSRDRGELHNAKQWVEIHDTALQAFAVGISTNHPVLWWTHLMRNVEAAIDQAEEHAIALGYRFVLDDFTSPHGRIHKRRVLKRLRRNIRPKDRSHIPALAKVIAKFADDGYKPQEYNDMLRLYEALSAIR